MDITMCCNHSCPRATKCYRHQAEPDYIYQAYQYFEADGCKFFIDMAEYGLEVRGDGDAG